MKNDKLYEEHREWASNELSLIGFKETEVGLRMMQLLESIHEVSGSDKLTMIALSSMFNRIVDRMPLSPLNNTPEEIISITNSDNSVTLINKRYPSVTTNPNSPDQFYDDEAIAFIHSDGHRYYSYNNGPISSRKKVSFPYTVNQEIIKNR